METAKHYRIVFQDATIVDQDERDAAAVRCGELLVLEHAVADHFNAFILPEDVNIENDGGDDWVDFSAAIRIVCEPEKLGETVARVIERDGRIEVYSVMDEQGEVVMTEENYQPA